MKNGLVFIGRLGKIIIVISAFLAEILTLEKLGQKNYLST